MRTTLLAVLPLFFSFAASAQIADYTKTTNSTGGSATIGSDVFEWSVGELVVTTESTSTITVTQGVLQPLPSTGNVKQMNNLRNTLSVYPNPTNAIINLKGDFKQAGTLDYMLQDITGKSIRKGQLAINAGISVQQIDLTSLADGAYMLNVLFTTPNNIREAASFKIDKVE